MHGDPFPDSYPDGREFFLFHPDTGEAIFGGGIDSEILARQNQGMLDRADEGVQVFAEISEVNDRVTDELTGAVVGGLSASIYLHMWVREYVWIEKRGFISCSANSINGRVFQREKSIWRFTT